MGLCTPQMGLDKPPMTSPYSIQKAIQQPNCFLVSYELEDIAEIEIYWFAFKRSASSDEDLKKAYKKIMNWHMTNIGPFTRKQIIHGIRWRAQNIFPNDPTYEKHVTEKLDKFLINFSLSSRQREVQRVRELITSRAQYLENMKIPKKSNKAFQKFNVMNMLLREIFLLPRRDPLTEITDALKNNDDVADFIRTNKIL